MLTFYASSCAGATVDGFGSHPARLDFRLRHSVALDASTWRLNRRAEAVLTWRKHSLGAGR